MNKVLLVLGGFLLTSTFVNAMEDPTDPTEMFHYLHNGFPNLTEGEFWDCYLETGGVYHDMIGLLKTKEFRAREEMMRYQHHPEPHHGSYPSSSSAYSPHSYKSDEGYSSGFSSPMNHGGYSSHSSTSYSRPTTSFSCPNNIESKRGSSSREGFHFPREMKSEFNGELPLVIKLIYDDLDQKISAKINDCIDRGLDLPPFPTKDGGTVTEPTNQAFIMCFEEIFKIVDRDYQEKRKFYDIQKQEAVEMKMFINQQQEIIESKPMEILSENQSPQHIDETFNAIFSLNLKQKDLTQSLAKLKQELDQIEENRMHIAQHIEYLKSKDK